MAPAHGTGGKAAPLPPGAILGCHGSPEQIWLPFMARELPQMRADGWQVEVMPGFRWQISAVEAWEGEAQPAGYGWFDLDLGIRVDGQRVPLLPLLLDLLKRLGRNGDPDTLLAQDPDAQLYATLPNGAHVALPVARIAPLIRVLLDLFSGNGNLDEEGRARIDLGQAALLDGASDLDLPPLLLPEQRDRLRRLLEPVTEAEPPAGLTADLRPYQRRGLGWLLALDAAGTGGVLADDMGLGKTLQVIAFIQTLKNEGKLKGPALVLAPTSVAPNWLREVGRHAPGLRAHLHQGLDRAKRWPDLDQIDLLVTGYPLLLRDHALLMDRTWSLLILDEAQVVKNQATKLAGLVRTLPAERRLCVTGTPLENHLGELWTQMDFVMPGLLGDSRNFGKLFRTPIEKQGDQSRRHLLAGRLRPFILRRAKAEVAGDLPPKTEIVERIPLPDDQRDLYETLRLAMDAKVRKAIAARGLARSHIVILEALLRLRQACCDPALLPATTAKRAKAVNSAKRQHLMQMLPEMVQEGRRILLFSQFTTMLDLIRADLDAAGLSHVSLTGDSIDRMGPVDRFQSGSVDVFLISLKAGGTGLTLTAADTVIHYDPWWNPAVEDQATDRAHRIGQDKPVFVYRLVAEGTVEERILDLQDRKRQLAAAIHDTGIEGPDALTEDDIDRLFAPLTGGSD
jgi:SNF2 family DNA or RNA helicase